MPTAYRLRRNTAAGAAFNNRILDEGEIGLETDTGRFKIGDGSSRWLELPYFVDTTAIQGMIDAAISDAPGGAAALYEHIHALAPHPAYDDGPSLLLLYENKKV